MGRPELESPRGPRREMSIPKPRRMVARGTRTPPYIMFEREVPGVGGGGVGEHERRMVAVQKVLEGFGETSYSSAIRKGGRVPIHSFHYFVSFFGGGGGGQMGGVETLNNRKNGILFSIDERLNTEEQSPRNTQNGTYNDQEHTRNKKERQQFHRKDRLVHHDTPAHQKSYSSYERFTCFRL